MTALDDPDFQRAFVAVRYAAGTRGSELLTAFEPATEAATSLERALAAADRNQRAQALAGELGRLARLLEARRLR